MSRSIRARGLVRGVASGPALVLDRALSFLGDVDLDTGEIIAADHPHRGETIAGKVLLYPEGKGSSGGCIVLMVLARLGRAPAALVVRKPADPNTVEAAILCGIPLLAEPEEELAGSVRTGDSVEVDGAAGEIRLA